MMISSSLFLFFLIHSKLENSMELEQSENFLIYRKLKGMQFRILMNYSIQWFLFNIEKKRNFNF